MSVSTEANGADTVVYLVRHGEVHNPGQILYGRMPRFRLSAAGREQAAATAAYLCARPLDAIYASPMLRARQTARAVAAACGLAVRSSARLTEIHTPFQGQPLEELARGGWAIYDDLAPEYELPEAILARMRVFLRRACAAHPGGRVAAVSHGDPIFIVGLWARRISLERLKAERASPYPAYASVLALALTPEGAVTSASYTCPWQDAANRSDWHWPASETV